MAQRTKIEWTEYSWNPVTGCTKISIGCQNCYAERMAIRLKAMGNKRYRNGFKVTVHDDLIHLPLKWRNSRMVFVNSMSDLFHEDVPLETIKDVFNVMNRLPQHTFQVLTKRSERLLETSHYFNWTHNIWMGVTVETNDYNYRIEHLTNTPARTKFVSFEPLLGEINFYLIRNVDWIIVGGESGPNAREMRREWVVSIRDYCLKHRVPYFFKQWGGARKKKWGRELDGKIWSQMPILTTDCILNVPCNKRME